MQSNWMYPEPRPGLDGMLDRFIGPGASPAEIALMVGTALGGGVLMVGYALVNDLGWSFLQIVIAALLAFDLAGGVVTNATAAAKRWYHREGQGFRQHFGFVAVHALHVLLMVLFFAPGDWGFFVVVYGYLLAAALIILTVPRHVQRPVAFTALMAGFLINAYIVNAPAGWEWFVPVFYLKLLVSHLLHEEPYP
ncbi:MAG: hypothetical protein OHK0046_34940 [Anaerolineae bacterium]